MAQNNDLTAFKSKEGGVSVKVWPEYSPIVETTFDSFGVAWNNNGLEFGGTLDAYMSYAKSFLFNLFDVSSIEIIRDTDPANAFEFILGDFVQSAVATTV
ncbi:MAG: hypothetical protein QM751_06205 [Paludibacteraceae bacterium]